MKRYLDNYKFMAGEQMPYSEVERAVLLGATLRSTKLLLESDKENCCLWEIHLEVACLTRDEKFGECWKSRLVSETYVDVETPRPREIINPEILLWFDAEEIDTLRERMMWREGHPEQMDFYSAEFFDVDKGDFDGDRKNWDPDELQSILEMSSEEVEELRKGWERKQTYRKFGL